MDIKELIAEAKEIDGGKILAIGDRVMGKLNPQAIKQAYWNFADGPIVHGAERLGRLAGDFIQWPKNFIDSVIGSFQDR